MRILAASFVLAMAALLGGCGGSTAPSASDSGPGGSSDARADASSPDAGGSSGGPDGSGSDSGADGPGSSFGQPCSSSMACTGMFDECRVVDIEMQECTKACNSNADCPKPPTDGECTPPNLPADAGAIGYCL